MSNKELVAFLVIGTGFFALWMSLVSSDFRLWMGTWLTIIPVFVISVYAVDYLVNHDII